jgi:hypothetical protein
VLLFRSPVSATSLGGYLVAFAGVKYYDRQRVADIRSAAESKDAASKGLDERASALAPLLAAQGSGGDKAASAATGGRSTAASVASGGASLAATPRVSA